MTKEERAYLQLILLHVGIGLLIFIMPILSKVYGYLIFGAGLFYVINKQNRNNEVLLVCSYIVGSEVFLRMTGGNPTYEISKYGVISFILIGSYYSGFYKAAVPYYIFLLLLVPGIVLAMIYLGPQSNVKKAISFNISGPICLAICSLYTFRRKLSFEQMNKIILALGLPIVTCTTYLIFYTPDIRKVITGTQSSFEASGGFGPNQVATILGLGMFIFFSRVLLESKSKLLRAINLIIMMLIGYRGVITFSRGGIITGLVMIILLLYFLYKKTNYNGKIKLNYGLICISVLMALGWFYTSYQTQGLIDKRYSNQDAAGRTKESKFSGREDIALNEISIFLKNPIFGVGVGKGTEIREQETGKATLSHDEITRMLAEHGILGVIGLLILLSTPLLLFIENKFNMYLLCFIAFWILTINHAAMRIAAPAFIYSLALINVVFRGVTANRENEFIDREHQ